MRTKMKTIAVAVCLLAAVLFPARVRAEGEEPFAEVTDLYLSTAEAEAGDAVSYRLKVTYLGETDEFRKNYYSYKNCSYECPLEAAVIWKSPGKQKVTRHYEWGTGSSLSISDTIPVQAGMQKGKWKLSGIYLIFSLDNYDEDYMKITGVSERAEILDSSAKGKKAYCPTVYADFSGMRFSVSTKKTDGRAPTLVTETLKLSKKSVKTGEKSTFSVKVKDDSRIEKVKSEWKVYGYVCGSEGGKKYRDTYGYTCEPVMKYNRVKKCYQCPLRLKKHDRSAELVAIRAWDIYGNMATYYPVKKYRKPFSRMQIKLK